MTKNTIDKERLIEVANAVEKRPSLISKLFSTDKTPLDIDCSCEKQKKHTGLVQNSNEPGTCYYCGKRIQDY